jgi:very-short-patch-repair endonuclease
MRETETRSRALAKTLRRSMPSAEVILWSRLKGKQFKGLHFRRQHPIGPYVADFVCMEAMTVLEIDGDQHAMPSAVMHDRARDAFMKGRGWKVIRLANASVYKELNETLEYLARELVVPPSGPVGHLPRKRGRKGFALPSPPPQAGEVSAQLTEGGGNPRDTSEAISAIDALQKNGRGKNAHYV